MVLQAERLDHTIICNLVKPASAVLDLGCGNGDLLYLLVKNKFVKAHGIEIDNDAIYECIAKGLSVIHGDLDKGLNDYADASFDYVIMNQSLEEVKNIEQVFHDALRVGRHVILGFPNFAHWQARLMLFFKGTWPLTKSFPYQWYNSPKLHVLSIIDFITYCRQRDILIEKQVFIAGRKCISILPNLLSENGIFLISNKGIQK